MRTTMPTRWSGISGSIPGIPTRMATGWRMGMRSPSTALSQPFRTRTAMVGQTVTSSLLLEPIPLPGKATASGKGRSSSPSTGSMPHRPSRNGCRARGRLGMRAGTDVDRRATEGRHVLGQFALHPVDYRVGFGNREAPIDRNVEIGMHPMSEPACSHLVHALHPIDMQRRTLDLGQDGRLDAIEETQE